MPASILGIARRLSRRGRRRSSIFTPKSHIERLLKYHGPGKLFTVEGYRAFQRDIINSFENLDLPIGIRQFEHFYRQHPTLAREVVVAAGGAGGVITYALLRRAWTAFKLANFVFNNPIVGASELSGGSIRCVILQACAAELSNLILKRMRELCPVDTGDLRDSIEIQDSFATECTENGTMKGSGEIKIIPTAPYAVYVENKEHENNRFVERTYLEFETHKILADEYSFYMTNHVLTSGIERIVLERLLQSLQIEQQHLIVYEAISSCGDNIDMVYSNDEPSISLRYRNAELREVRYLTHRDGPQQVIPLGATSI